MVQHLVTNTCNKLNLLFSSTCSLNGELSLEELLIVLCDATEFDELPVRHNEDLLNADLAKKCPLDCSTR